MNRFFIILFFILTIPNVSSYPNYELSNIIKEKYPNYINEKDIIFRDYDDGLGMRIIYNSPDFPIPDDIEKEQLWQKIQEKRALEAQNQTEKMLSNQDLQTKYLNQINNLNTVVNNSNYIQAKMNWTNAEVVQYMKVLAWHDEVLAKGQIAILKILRWMLW